MIIRGGMGDDAGLPFNAVTGEVAPGPWAPQGPPKPKKKAASSEGPAFRPDLMASATPAKRSSAAKWIVGGAVVAAGVGYALLGRKRR